MDSNFWRDKTSAQRILKEKKFQEHLIQSYNNSVNECKELSDLYDLANEENNQSILNECFKRIDELKIKTKKNDSNLKNYQFKDINYRLKNDNILKFY